MARWKKRIGIAGIALVSALAVFAAVLGIYSAYQNQTVQITDYVVEHDDIPASFDGKRIVHLTDLHNKDYGGELETLVAAQNPDIIVITGDWIGMLDEDITPAKEQATALVEIAPVYYVAGNHEYYSSLWQELKAHLQSCGVTILQNETADWQIGEDAVQLVGIFGPDFNGTPERFLASLVEENAFSLVLYHHPEYYERAVEYGVDLMLCGHTHGGQIRLPLIGAVFAPDQGWFPKYDVGRFDTDGTTMIISQGLGQSAYVRILTPPEIVTVTLKSNA